MTDPDPVAALAAQLAELRGQLARSQSELHDLRLEVRQLRDALAEAVGKHRVKPPPAPWWQVSREEGAEMLAELRGWVDSFLRPHYADYLMRLPRCWPSHMAAVWELSVLRAEWVRVYGDEDNRDLQGALTWHDRYLPDVITRLSAAIRCDEAGCRLSRRGP